MECFTIHPKITSILIVLLLSLFMQFYLLTRHENENNEKFSKTSNSLRNHQCNNISDGKKNNSEKFGIIITQNYEEERKLGNVIFSLMLHGTILNLKFLFNDVKFDFEPENFLPILENLFLDFKPINCLELTEEIGDNNNDFKIWFCFERSNNCYSNYKDFKIMKIIEIQEYPAKFYNNFCLNFCSFIGIEVKNITSNKITEIRTKFNDATLSHRSSKEFSDFTNLKKMKYFKWGKFSLPSNYTLIDRENLLKRKNNIKLNDSDKHHLSNVKENTPFQEYSDTLQYHISIEHQHQFVNKSLRMSDYYLFLSEILQNYSTTTFLENLKIAIQDFQKSFKNYLPQNISKIFKSITIKRGYNINQMNNQYIETIDIDNPFLNKGITFIFTTKQQQQQETNTKIILKLDLSQKEKLLLVEYKGFTFESENKFSPEFSNKITLKNHVEEETRSRSIQSISKRCNINFPPFVIIRSDKMNQLTSDWINYYGHQRLYEWRSGEKEEWIFHRIESKIWPFLNHNISQLVFLNGKMGGWESVVGSFAIGKFSVFAHFNSQLEYINKICRIYIQSKQDWKYSNIYLSYKRLEKDYFEIETKLDSFDAVLTFRLKCSATKDEELLNCFAEAAEQDIWNTFTHKDVWSNSSFSISPFPLSWKSRISVKNFFQDELKVSHLLLMFLENRLNTSELRNFINLITWEGNFINFFSTEEETDQELYINEDES